ncbi:MAG: PID-CTERM protein-sorting domain-containing protein [Flavipsychrobacter sp.]
MKLKALVTTLLIVCVLLCLPSLLHAQGMPGDPGGDPDVPIDGGLSLLLAAGAGYGAKKVNDRRKKNNTLAKEDSRKI